MKYIFAVTVLRCSDPFPVKNADLLYIIFYVDHFNPIKNLFRLICFHNINIVLLSFDV